MIKQIRPFTTVLVANRGEIAVRILRTLRSLGYGTVAVYSDADRNSAHVKLADCAVHIGAAAPSASYLNSAAIIAAALKSGADAIHPAYGFLAENGGFADAVDAAGLVFIGPSGGAIRAMGNKARAKQLMLDAGLPCIPGYQGEDQGDAAFVQAAQDIGWPVMVKAACGGGGRGMRLVHEAGGLLAALASARSEALAAFGSDELILERAIIQPRHIEVQVLADSHGHIIHLGERDCSVQRRHQKLIEEAPSPAVNAALRERMGMAALNAARSIDYLGVGTVEFLLDHEGNYYFMEMNTRLQVEHAVTEAIAGLDLVEWQLRVAAGEPLTLQQHDVCLAGHAIEVRLTAEDVPGGFLPQTGPILHWSSPAAEHDVRVEHALAIGDEVSPHYDSLIAKLIAHGRTREEARRKLVRALESCMLLGVPTNQRFLADCLQHPAFVSGQAHTGFVGEYFLDPASMSAAPTGDTVVVAALALLARSPAAMSATPPLGHEVLRPSIELALGDTHWNTVFAWREGGWRATIQSEAGELMPVMLRHIEGAGTGVFTAEIDGVRRSARAVVKGDTVYLFYKGQAWVFRQWFAHAAQDSMNPANGAILAPLTGRIVDVAVAQGDRVEAGQTLVVLEAMKMEHTLTAPMAGKVSGLCVQTGGQTSAGALLMHIGNEDTAVVLQEAS